ncbi:MAG TPA: hypothetical protein DD979_06305 [Gammaproteobacteria bacterium]|jgi:type IV pilus assembly protein PilC|nr:hypothetical protein [Gammaproteobacteria bacterium]
MPDFSYRAVDKAGHNIEGTMTADNEAMLNQQLHGIGYWLIDAELQSKINGPRKVSVTRKELIEFCSAMAAMLGAGISIVDAFRTMTEQSTNPGFLHVMEDISLNIEAGNTIADSMLMYPNVFPSQVCNLIKAGEVSGNLPGAFKDLQLHLEWVDKLVSEIKQISIYPAMVLVTVVLFIILLFTFVVPKFAEILVSLDVPLPVITKWVMAAGEFTKAYWWALIGVPIVVAVVLRYAIGVSEELARKADELKLKLPIFGEIAKMVALSKFAHNMGILVKSGVSILQALTLCKDMVGNRVVADAIADAEVAVNEGKTISSVLRQHEVFPPMMLRMITVGEESGQFEQSMLHVSSRYDEEIPVRVKRVFSILEPAIMLTLIGIIGVVSLAIFLPLVSVMGGIG